MSRIDISNAFKIFMCCTGTVIGAGFASGQEIMSFFGKYAHGGWGLCISGVLFFLYVYMVLKKIYIYNTEDFDSYFSNIVGRKALVFIKSVAYGFMLASFCVMVSGSGAVAEDVWGGKTVGILFMAGLSFIAFLKGTKGMVAVNAIMTPLIIIGMLLVGVLSLWGEGEVFLNFSKILNTDNFLSSALIYVSYNTVTLIGVLIPLKDKITSKSVALWSSFFSGALLFAVGLILWAVMKKHNVPPVPVPMLYIAQMRGVIVKYAYAAVLYMAMITTAVSSGYAFLSFIKKYVRLKNSTLSLGVCTLSVPLAYVGFADLVNKLYRFFGFLGMFVLVLVIADGIFLSRDRKTKKFFVLTK